MLILDSLTYRYANGKGVGPVNLEIPSGQTCALIGPNGSGKSTLFSILAGILHPQEGSVRVDGEAAGGRIPPTHLGFLPETPFLPQRLTACQAVQFEAAMRARALLAQEAEAHLAAFHAAELRHQPIRTLSQGQSKRVELACACLGNPPILILDEPLNGLDIESVLMLRDALMAHKEQGATIVLSSHILDFLDDVADRIVFIGEGRILGEVAPAEDDAEAAYRRIFME